MSWVVIDQKELEMEVTKEKKEEKKPSPSAEMFKLLAPLFLLGIGAYVLSEILRE